MEPRWNPFEPPRTAWERRLILATTAVALVVPGVVGALVKLQLDAIGKPTLTWSAGVAGMVPITIASAIGWMLYALACRWFIHRYETKPLIVAAAKWAWLVGLAGGSCTLAPTLHALLQDAAIAMMVAILAPYLFWKSILLGAAAGFVAGFALRYSVGCLRSSRTRPA